MKSTYKLLLIILKEAHIILLWIQSPNGSNNQQTLQLPEKVVGKGGGQGVGGSRIFT